MTIEAAADEVRLRSINDVALLWREVEFPSAWGSTASPHTLREYVQSTRSQEQAANGGIFADEDARDIALSEMLAIVAKAAHLTRALQSAHSAGHYTVSAFNGFHGCLFSARALMACFGVFVFSCNYAGKTVNCFIDIFPWLGSIDYAKKFRKDNGASHNFVRLRSFKRKLESQDIWKVLVRILRIATMDCLTKTEQLKLQSFDYGRLAKQRNALVYQGPVWTWPLDILFEVSRYFEPGSYNQDIVTLLELAETEDYPEYILNGLLFAVLERVLLTLFPDQAAGKVAEEGKVISSLLFGASPRASYYARPPLSFLRP
jgi:hypothetical protein